ncbi:MAG: hypothetical protein KA165_20335 [Saprospiraceae bacterium]|nr:hypothetical protein [Lewinellaceae bacterium]MBP6828928.1 hypothetical protein [Saprospiraceae bacterium]
MIRSLVKIGILLVVAILVYNYFFGTDTERDNSRKIFGQMRDVVVSVGQLVKTEKNNFNAGKYDAALDKLGDAYRAIRDRAQYVDEKVLKRLDELEDRKAQLQTEIDSIEKGDQAADALAKKGLKKDAKSEQQKATKAADQKRRKEELQRELESLLRDSESLLKQAEEN